MNGYTKISNRHFSKGDTTNVNRKLLAWSQNGTTPKDKNFRCNGVKTINSFLLE